MNWIDTHAHIYAESFQADLDQVLQEARELGVSRIYMPNIDVESIDLMLEVEQKYSEQCIATMGLHPCHVDKDFEKQLYIMEDWLSKRPFVAVGEIGTDLYWDKTYFEQQKEAFNIQANWAKKYQIPIIIHCRESIDENIELVAALKDERLTGVFHCFSGDLDQAKKIIDLGFMLGIGGVATFKNGGLDKVLTHIDPKHIVLETDSPYLAPTPHRGKRNSPAYIPLIARRVSELMSISEEEIANITTLNALRLFKAK
ncbi:TatD family hydrolase [Penaeicola halotolerans]|uniref:TatD family hydrolase n=1 Tax=Penaeicola halotolerans TaxID=2793196 RepID=UPI001CF853E9|nr:TatD family hydrolase [Penaeicola halotolerans]